VIVIMDGIARKKGKKGLVAPAEDEEQMAKQEEEEAEEHRMRRVELGRPSTPKHMSLWMSLISEDND
jgi:hypothetical protein